MNKVERMANEGDFKYFKGKISPHLQPCKIVSKSNHVVFADQLN
jgi:hypothetical protein